jgi:hypothetical protein
MRRFAALIGIVVVLALAATLLWQVWLHHNETLPLDGDDEPSVMAFGRVRSDIRKNCERSALNSSSSNKRQSGTRGAISEVRRQQIT